MLFDKLKDVYNEETFIEFMNLLHKDYSKNKSQWQNHYIDDFLECSAEWASASIDGLKYYNKEINPWKRCAGILYMGKIYE